LTPEKLTAGLVLDGLVVPVGSLLRRQGLEVSGDDLGDVAELGFGVGLLHVAARGVRVEEESRLISLGGCSTNRANR